MKLKTEDSLKVEYNLPSALVCVSGSPRRFRGPPEGHVSQEGGQAEPGGLCENRGPAGGGTGTGNHLPGAGGLAEPR